MIIERILHGAAVFGVFFLNYAIYATSFYLVGILIAFVFYQHTDADEATVELVVRIIMIAVFLLTVLMTVLYLTGVFRLIPLP